MLGYSSRSGKLDARYHSGGGSTNRGKTLWKGAIITGLWILWLQWNRRILDDCYSSIQEMWDRLIFLANAWVKARGHYSNHALIEIHQNWDV